MTKSIFLLAITIFGAISAFAQPNISLFLPTNGSAGSSITMVGSGFNGTASNNKVYVGGAPAVVIDASPSQLTITVPDAAAGRGKIMVINTVTKLSTVSRREFTRTFSGGIATSAAASTQFPTNNTMTGPSLSGEGSSETRGFKLVSGDFDNDGKIDYGAMGTTASNSMTIFKNTAATGAALTNASFTSATTLTLDANSQTVYPYAEDINGDGLLDILVSRTNGFTIFINTSAGAGSFSFTKSTYTPSATFYSNKSILVDLDKDGLPDIASINVNVAGVSYYKNTSSGGTLNFNTTPTNRATPQAVGDIVAADLDNDGDNDIIVSSTAGVSNQAVYYNLNTNTISGTISMAAAPFTTITGTLPSGSFSGHPVALGTADFDNDGDMDIVSITKGGSGTGGGWVYIHRNDGV